VPFFFLTAGYFYRGSWPSRSRPAHYLRYAGPLARVYAAWFAIYCVVPRNWASRVAEQGLWSSFLGELMDNTELLINRPWYVLFPAAITEKTSALGVLWFLPALLVAVGMLHLVLARNWQRRTLLLVGGLYTGAVLEEALSESGLIAPLHVDLWLLGILLVLLGSWWADQPKPTLGLAVGLLLGGCVVRYGELQVLQLFPVSPVFIRYHTYLGGILFAMGIFTAALARPYWGVGMRLSRLAPWTLGIYVSHMLVIATFAVVLDAHWLPNLFARIAFGLLIYTLSLALTITLSRLPGLHTLVVKRRDEGLDLRGGWLGFSQKACAWLLQFAARLFSRPPVDGSALPDSPTPPRVHRRKLGRTA
jgi:surface polysaccharide O-acyltransferase-like enzyme